MSLEKFFHRRPPNVGSAKEARVYLLKALIVQWSCLFELEDGNALQVRVQGEHGGERPTRREVNFVDRLHLVLEATLGGKLDFFPL